MYVGWKRTYNVAAAKVKVNSMADPASSAVSNPAFSPSPMESSPGSNIPKHRLFPSIESSLVSNVPQHQIFYQHQCFPSIKPSLAKSDSDLNGDIDNYNKDGDGWMDLGIVNYSTAAEQHFVDEEVVSI